MTSKIRYDVALHWLVLWIFAFNVDDFMEDQTFEILTGVSLFTQYFIVLSDRYLQKNVKTFMAQFLRSYL